MTRVLSVAGLLAPLLLPLVAIAGQADPMSAAEFEAYVRGKTLTYNSNGTPYGIEEYLDNRRVRWAFSGDECVDGYWYEQGGMICFSYETDLEPQCWTFEKGPLGLIARFENDPLATELYETRQSDQPMACLGPRVGA